MRDSIYTIPISEVFEPKCGCPICALEKTLNERWVEYITGAAMMEPDVRVETNRHGFCAGHFDMMLGGRGGRLSIALILQTRLAWIDSGFDRPPLKRWQKKIARDKENIHGDGCFVCVKVEAEKKRIASNIAAVWARESDFRQLFAEQEFLCHGHAELLTACAKKELRGKNLAAFRGAAAALTRKRLRAVKADIDAFCNSFDYHNAGAPHPGKEIAVSIERAVSYLAPDSRAGETLGENDEPGVGGG